MKICFISPPDKSKIEPDIEYCYNAYNVPHLGLGYIVSYLKKNGFEVQYLECVGQRIKLEKLFSIIQEKQYDVIGISSYDYNSYNLVRIVERIKQICPHAFIMLGGYYATLNYKNLLETLDIDCCVCGEGEETNLELLQCLSLGLPYQDIRGIAYKKDGHAIKNESRPLIMELDALPFPERPFIARRKMATLVTARGCYGCCSFCSIRAFYQDLTGPRIRFRSPENIVEEIALLIEHRGVRFINFVDDNFVVNTPQNISRLNRLCDLLETRCLDFQFSITVRANDYIKNEDLLKRLQQVGLKYVFIGIESLIQRQLNLYEKKIEVWENEEAFRLSKRLNLKVDIGFILFDPFVELDEVIYNIEALLETSYFDFMYAGGYMLSMYSALAPVFGSKVRTLLMEKHMYSQQNPFAFQNEDVALCYKLMKIWSMHVYDVNIRYYLIMKAEDLGFEELSQRLYCNKVRLAKHDARFIIALCRACMEKIVNEDNFDLFLKDWLDELDEIDQQFRFGEKQLRELVVKEIEK